MSFRKELTQDSSLKEFSAMDAIKKALPPVLKNHDLVIKNSNVNISGYFGHDSTTFTCKGTLLQKHNVGIKCLIDQKSSSTQIVAEHCISIFYL